MMKIRSLAAALAVFVAAGAAHAGVLPSSGDVPRGAFADGPPSSTPSSASPTGETPAATMLPSIAEMLRTLDIVLPLSAGPESDTPAVIAAEAPDVGVLAVPEPGAPAVAGLALALAALVSRRARRHAR